MSKKRWIVKLDKEERDTLRALISKGRSAAQKILKARILLKADEGPLGNGWSDERIAEALETSATQVARERRKLVEEGMAAVFTRKRRATPPRKRIFDGEAEARLIALSCTEPPEGHAHWTIRLLAREVVSREIVETVHHNTVGRCLKKIL